MASKTATFIPSVQHCVFIWTLFYLGRHVVQTADIPYMDRTIRFRFSKVRNHFVDPDVKDVAREFIYEEFRRLGLEAEHNHFQYSDTTKNLSDTSSNVVGLIKGTRFGTAADKIIGVGAHFDTVATSTGLIGLIGSERFIATWVNPWLLKNYDQAKRVVVPHGVIVLDTMMEYNTSLHVSPPPFSSGLIGSEQFIATWVNPWLLKNYGQAARAVVPHGVIVLDTMMEYNTSDHSQILPDETVIKALWPDTYNSVKSDNFRGDFLTLIYRSRTPDDPLAGAFQTAWDVAGRDQFELGTWCSMGGGLAT